MWQGTYQNQGQTRDQLWLRWWDAQGNLLLTGHEQADFERHRTEQERQRAEQERQRAEQERQTRSNAIPQLLAMGLSVEQVADALGFSVQEVQSLEES